jgi:ABC-2 type transport system permease protein
LTLAVLLVFSGSIILYSILFNAPESAFLLATPARADQVFAYKFQGAVAFSSWAFVLLGMPILLAFGAVYEVPWGYYALLPVYFVGFLLVPGSVGALGCLVVVNVLPRKRTQVLALAGVLLVVTVVGLAVRGLVMARTANSGRDALQGLLGQFAFARSAWLPSHWMTRGVQAAARGEWLDAAYPLALLWGNGLMLYVVAAYAAVKLYRRGYNRLATGGTLRKRYGGARLDRTVSFVLWFLDPQTRLLIVKDFRTFRRDPAQWAQILIFAGLILLYSGNSRQFYQNDLGRVPRQLVSLMNLVATAMLICAYMGRFIYPMLSLEGRKFWILGLLPMKRERLLWGKFAFAMVGAVLVGEPLVLASDLLLGMPGEALLLHGLTLVVAATGLSGLSVGIGACLPNFRESDPSKIAVGFGGTLNLLAGLMYLSAVVVAMAGPYHFFAVVRSEDVPVRDLGPWLTAGVTSGVTACVAATFLPLRAGARALRQMEF